MDVNVLIVGGGIQGVGLLHDLATRRVPDIVLAESHQLASGTSSRSTKLVHGGLRYLEHFSQWPLVREALQERAILLRVLKGIVKPIPFVLPNYKGGRPDWFVRLGLTLYDSFGGDSGLPRSRSLAKSEILQTVPYLKPEFIEKNIHSAFLFYDAQMLDDVIVKMSAYAAQSLGARVLQNTRVTKIEARRDGGFTAELTNGNEKQTLTTKTVVNAAGAWTNENLLKWGIVPNVSCILNVGSHLVFSEQTFEKKPHECAATLLQNDDGRIVFFIPWDGKWLLGTTESILPSEPRPLEVPFEDIAYLKNSVSSAIDLGLPENLVESFCGVRTMPIVRKRTSDSVLTEWMNDPFKSPFYIKKFTKNISGLSRESVIDESLPDLISIYGGKYTTYRALAEKLGAKISRRLGQGGQSSTQMSEAWFIDDILKNQPDILNSDKSIRNS